MKKSKEVKAYYEERYHDKSRFHRKLEDYTIYLKYLGINKSTSGKFLDIACGRGLLLKNTANYGLKPIGLDISLSALKILKNDAVSFQTINCAAEDIGFKANTFEYISCLGSLEHFLDIPKAISEMRRIAKENTLYCIVVPNNIHYRLDAKSKWGIKKVVGTRQQEMHEELHSLQEWKTILKENGLEILKIYKDRFFIKKKNVLKNLLFYLWLKYLPMKYSYQFIFICKSGK